MEDLKFVNSQGLSGARILLCSNAKPTQHTEQSLKVAGPQTLHWETSIVQHLETSHIVFPMPSSILVTYYS